MDAQDRADRVRRRRARARSRPAACGWSSPPRPASTPDCAITSGIRKPPPISTSCPRETTIARPGPGQRRRREQHGAGAVVDDDRRLGAGQLAQQRPDVGVAAAARRRCRGRARGCCSPSAARPPPRAPPPASGARPRLVWTITPVALITRRSEGRLERAEQLARRARCRLGSSPPAAPARIARGARRSPGGPRPPPARGARRARPRARGPRAALSGSAAGVVAPCTHSPSSFFQIGACALISSMISRAPAKAASR